MVFSIGGRKIEATAGLLAEVSFSQSNKKEEVGSQKLTAKYIQRELHDANEANLLDEEDACRLHDDSGCHYKGNKIHKSYVGKLWDMHVFDLMPLTDPLHLVLCNACRKPIKVSQYAAHAEICKSLGITEEMVSELNGGTGNKKRPKKERKKLAAAYASTPSEEQERLHSAKAAIKRNSSCVEGAPTINGSGVSPGISDYSTNAVPPPTKCSKLIIVEAVDKSDHLRIATGVAKRSCQNTEGANTCRGHLKMSTGRCKQCSDCVGYHNSDQVCGLGLQLHSKALLGTKVFYSLRNHRLRSAVKCMYYESFSREQSDDVHPNVSQGDDIELRVSIPTNFHGELNVPMEKGEEQPLTFTTSVRKPEQVLANCSDVYMGKLGHISSVDFSNHDPVNSSLNSQASSMGNMRSNYLPQSFAFEGNSGSSLGTMQQPKGSVPVT